MKMCYIEKINAYVEKEELRYPTISDLIDNGYEYHEFDIEYPIQNGEEVGSSLCRNTQTGKIKEISDALSKTVEEGFDEIYYHDGNNWVTDIFEEEEIEDVGECEIDKIYSPDDTWFAEYMLTIEDTEEEIKVSKSCCSGGLSPYYYVCE